ncbi:hypothetical protein BGW38_001670 [Lunasporangiospora selenospora]|uniref:GATA-type domain-containing protein n=1 Tax=Lunasporangiospora selenospora TaxID=979761 RepID=A0A9P6G221_9FUNG|nr:hypothetical protein BGW38_001670 [Lunasporangiospora selenospora]
MDSSQHIHSGTSQGSPSQKADSSSGIESVHCFWALMTYGDLRFIYLSTSVQRAVSAKYKQLLGKSFFDYIHPDEAKLARKDLNAFMDVHNLYGSVTRCRFKNVCPEWQQRKLGRQMHASKSASAASLTQVSSADAMLAKGLGQTGLQNGSNATNNNLTSAPDLIHTTTTTDDKHFLHSQAKEVMLENVRDLAHEGECKDYEHIFQNGEEEEYMILDVVMNVVSDEVVLGFFHIDGQGPYKGFWSNGICGEPKESLVNLAPEMLRHLQDSVDTKPTIAEHSPRSHSPDEGSDYSAKEEGAQGSSPPTIPRQIADRRTKRIFQVYDTQNRNLLLTWPEPSDGGVSPNLGSIAYNPDLYTQIVKSHHIPADALENTTCLKRFCSKHTLPTMNSSGCEPSYQVESVFIPYGHIIFACFQTSPFAPTGAWAAVGSPSTSLVASAPGGPQHSDNHPSTRIMGNTLGGGAPADHLSGLGVLSSPSPLGSSVFGTNGSSGGSPVSVLNSPLVIPSLPSLSPFLRNSVVSQSSMSPGVGSSTSTTGPIRNGPGSTHGQSSFHPYSRSSAGISSPSSASSSSSPPHLPLPDTMQESLSFLDDYKTEALDRGHAASSHLNDTPSSMWHASTPHPAIAAMVGHALAPSAPSFQRHVSGGDGRSQAIPSQLSPTIDGRLSSAFSGSEDGLANDSKATKSRKASSPRHPAHDAAVRKKLNSTGSTIHSTPKVRTDSSTGARPGATNERASLSTTGSSNGHSGTVMKMNQEEKACESCGTTNSPEWRRGQSGKKDLCNACGLRYSRSVARQNRLAQKQLDGKVAKTKGPKPGKVTKAGVKKIMDTDASSMNSGSDPTSVAHAQQTQLSSPGLGPSPFSMSITTPSLYQTQ